MLHWRRIKVYARSVWDVIIIITAFCLANDGHLLFSAQWLQKPLGGEGLVGGGSWWEVLTRGWLIYWASSSPSSPTQNWLWAPHVSPLCLLLPFSSVVLLVYPSLCLLFLLLHLYFDPTFTFLSPSSSLSLFKGITAVHEAIVPLRKKKVRGEI